MLPSNCAYRMTTVQTMNTVDIKPKFHHYCYVCNTQLNSCKQALLHCNGKRHRKKLHFLQSGNNATGHSPISHIPTPTMPVDQSSAGFMYPALSDYQQPIFNPDTSVMPPLPTPTSPPIFYPTMIPSRHTPHIHDHWVPPTMISYHHMPHSPPPFGNMMLSIQQLNGNGPFYPNITNNHLSAPTDISMRSSGAYSILPRSVVVSPSETTSVVSSETFPVILHKCHVCNRHFGDCVQLQNHLKLPRHYKTVNSTQVYGPKVGDSSETDSLVSSTSVYYCTLCKVATKNLIAIENDDQKRAINTQSVKIKSRSTMGQRRLSRSSSTSSDPIEIVVDSGYVSGSGDELICVSHPTPDKPTAKFRCQLCNTFLNSPTQAKQHLSSQKHKQRVSSCSKQTFRRKTTNNSFKKKHNFVRSNEPCCQPTDSTLDTPSCCHSIQQLSDNCDSSSLHSLDADADAQTVVIVSRGARSL